MFIKDELTNNVLRMPFHKLHNYIFILSIYNYHIMYHALEIENKILLYIIVTKLLNRKMEFI